MKRKRNRSMSIGVGEDENVKRVGQKEFPKRGMRTRRSERKSYCANRDDEELYGEKVNKMRLVRRRG
jgi:hypothetical protein